MCNLLRVALSFLALTVLIILVPTEWFTVPGAFLGISVIITIIFMLFGAITHTNTAPFMIEGINVALSRIGIWILGSYFALTGQAWIVNSYSTLAPLWVSWVMFPVGVLLVILSVIRIKRSTVTPYPQQP